MIYAAPAVLWFVAGISWVSMGVTGRYPRSVSFLSGIITGSAFFTTIVVFTPT